MKNATDHDPRLDRKRVKKDVCDEWICQHLPIILKQIKSENQPFINYSK